MLEAWREAGRQGAQVLQEPASPARSEGLRLRTSPKSGPRAGVHAVSVPSSLPRAGQGEEGAAGFPWDAKGYSPQPPPRFHPACRRACFGPSSLQGWAEGGQQAEPGPASSSSPAACAPCFAALCHAASITQSSPGSPHSLPSLLEPLRRRLGEWYSSLPGTHPSLHRVPREEAWGAAPRVPPLFSLLLPPIRAHTNHVIVLCFCRQFLDSDMPRYYLFPLVFFPPPLPLSLLSFSPLASVPSLPPEAALGQPAPHPSTRPIPPPSRPGTSCSLSPFCCSFGPCSCWLPLPLARLRPHHLIWVFFLLFDFAALPSLQHPAPSVLLPRRLPPQPQLSPWHCLE